MAIVYGFVAVFMYVAMPGGIGPMFPPWYVTALPIAGVASYFLGLAIMVRIYRANAEPGKRTWRYRP